MFVDFHSHSTFSDGTLTPCELVKMANDKKIQMFSITDHDNVDGQLEAFSAAKSFGIDYVAGVEISCEYPTMLDMLGYGYSVGNNFLVETLEELKKYRINRNTLMIEKLNGLGIEITLEEVAAQAGGDVIGRPHFARVMQNKGYVSTKEEAFEKYLGDDRPGYVRKKRLTPQQAIELITIAGGVSVLAHPKYLNLEKTRFENLVKHLKDFGLWGIEVFYSKNTFSENVFFEEIALKYDLFITAGSDYHGANSMDVSLGMKVDAEKIVKTMQYFR